MIVIGSKFVKFDNIDLVEFNLENLQNKSEFIKIKSKREAILANANGIKFLVCSDFDLARKVQVIANDYLFDSKVALIINDEIDFEIAIEARIDAVIYKNSINKKKDENT